MEAVRINGIKEHLDRLSDDELAGYLVHTAERIDQVNADMGLLQGELHRRFNVPLPIETTSHDPTGCIGGLAIQGEVTDPHLQ